MSLARQQKYSSHTFKLSLSGERRWYVGGSAYDDHETIASSTFLYENSFEIDLVNPGAIEPWSGGSSLRNTASHRLASDGTSPHQNSSWTCLTLASGQSQGIHAEQLRDRRCDKLDDHAWSASCQSGVGRFKVRGKYILNTRHLQGVKLHMSDRSINSVQSIISNKPERKRERKEEST